MLTEAQKTKNIKTNKVIIKVFGIIGALIIAIVILFKFTESSDKNKKTESNTSNNNMDSLTLKVKADKMYHIKDVYYNKKDSSFKIAFNNYDNRIKDKLYSTIYFESTYHLDSLQEVEGVYLYAYNPKMSLKNGDYKTALAFVSRHLGEVTKRFDDKFRSVSVGYTPVYDYLKQKIDDPESLEILGGTNMGMNEDSTFEIQTQFSAKNGFGGRLKHLMHCNVAFDGNVSNVKLDQ